MGVADNGTIYEYACGTLPPLHLPRLLVVGLGVWTVCQGCLACRHTMGILNVAALVPRALGAKGGVVVGHACTLGVPVSVGGCLPLCKYFTEVQGDALAGG